MHDPTIKLPAAVRQMRFSPGASKADFAICHVVASCVTHATVFLKLVGCTDRHRIAAPELQCMEGDNSKYRTYVRGKRGPNGD
jgi:hypothetical protein